MALGIVAMALLVQADDNRELVYLDTLFELINLAQLLLGGLAAVTKN